MTDYVRRTGTIFRVGNYPTKDFSLTADEARAAIAAFTPCSVDLEHIPTVLSDRLGTLETVEMAADGETLVGTVALPAWLDALLGEDERKVSATWNRETKMLQGLAIVRTPHVTDAALFAAFSAAEPAAAIPVAVEAEFMGKRHSASDQDRLNAIAEHAVALGAENPGMTGAPAVARQPAQKGTAKMSNPFTAALDYLRGTEYPADDLAAFAAAIPATPATATGPTEREKALEAQVASLVQRDIDRDAAQFADTEIAERRAFPGERAALVASFTQAATDDRANPATVTFAAGSETKQGSRVDALRALTGARLPHKLAGERVAAFALPANTGETDEQHAARRHKELLGATAMGRAALDAAK